MIHGKVYFLVSIIRIITERKGRIWAIATVIILIGGIALYSFVRSREVIYPEDSFSEEYRLNQRYLLNVAGKEPPDFTKFKSSLLFSQIAIVKEEDFPRFTKKLRQELFKAADNDFFFHSIAIGGLNIRDIDEPLLKASKRLRMYGRSNIEIVIVEPSTISSETQRILEKRGLMIRKITNTLNNGSHR